MLKSFNHLDNQYREFNRSAYRATSAVWLRRINPLDAISSEAIVQGYLVVWIEHTMAFEPSQEFGETIYGFSLVIRIDSFTMIGIDQASDCIERNGQFFNRWFGIFIWNLFFLRWCILCALKIDFPAFLFRSNTKKMLFFKHQNRQYNPCASSFPFHLSFHSVRSTKGIILVNAINKICVRW